MYVYGYKVYSLQGHMVIRVLICHTPCFDASLINLKGLRGILSGQLILLQSEPRIGSVRYQPKPHPFIRNPFSRSNGTPHANLHAFMSYLLVRHFSRPSLCVAEPLFQSITYIQ